MGGERAELHDENDGDRWAVVSVGELQGDGSEVGGSWGGGHPSVLICLSL